MNEEEIKPYPIRDEFAVHLLNEDGLGRAADVAKLFSVCLNHIESVVGSDGREMAIVRTKLQEAAFFAKRAIAVKQENRQ